MNSSIWYLYFSLFKKPGRLGMVFCSLHWYMCCFAKRMRKSTTASVCMFFSQPRTASNSDILKLFMFWHFMFIVFVKFFQNCWITAHCQNMCLMLSLVLLQKLHKSLFKTPISFKITFVPKHLCNILIWNHFNLTSETLWVLRKQLFQSISSLNFSFHFIQHFGSMPFSISMS